MRRFDVLVDTVFIVDIVLNFRTAYIADPATGDLVDEPKKIARYYMVRWFAVDLISGVPFDWVNGFSNNDGGGGGTATMASGLSEDDDGNGDMIANSGALKTLRLVRLMLVLVLRP